jgi:arachidonate 15-lipoxygenase
MVTIPQSTAPIQPSLPQFDTPEEQQERRQALAKNQEQYLLDNVNALGLPLLKTPLPAQEAFDNRYSVERQMATEPMLNNEERVTPLLSNPLGPVSGLADYDEMFIDLKAPDIASSWLTDESFGEQRLSGVNPVMLTKVSSRNALPDTLDQTQLDQALKGPEKIDNLIAEKRLYAIDFTPYLTGIPEGSVPTPAACVQGPNGCVQVPAGHKQKYLPKPIGLFFWDASGATNNDPALKNGRLLPLAIQVDTSDTTGKILTPASPELLWASAKLCFSVADANVHEMSTHLGQAHFAQESFGAITPCQLAPEHPVGILLKPHLRFLVFNNQMGMEKLVQKGGPVEQLLAATLQGSLDIAVKAAKSWSVMETFPESLENRGVNCEETLPHYPFRDDGLLIWEAIAGYVKEYIEIYYQSDDDVKNDYELQAWAKALADTGPNGGHIKDMPAEIDTISTLARILSVIIFHNSAGHSSVNYPQYPYIGFSPNMPLAGYSDYRAFFAKEDTQQREQLTFMREFLPPQILALGQIDITNSLSVYHYDSLGDYAKELTDPLAKHTLYRFTQRLSAIEKQIEIRNRQRLVSYKYLKPSEILNSASI